MLRPGRSNVETRRRLGQTHDRALRLVLFRPDPARRVARNRATSHAKADATLPLNQLLHNHLRLQGTVMKSSSPAEKRAMVERFAEIALPLMADGRLRPLIHAQFPLDRTADTRRLMKASGGMGKIIMAVDGPGPALRLEPREPAASFGSAG